MAERVFYMLSVVAVGWAVTFGLRSLPFVLFAGRDRQLPAWVERLGNFVSPIIIAGLIVYSYTGLEWRTAWPYLAGLLTVGLQLWRRNPLVSIIAGTIVYMCFLNCGCTAQRTLELDAEHPAVSISAQGVKFGDDFVPAEKVPQILEDYDVPHTRVIHIQLDPNLKDLRPARTLMGYLSRAGYTRPVLITSRHGESYATGKRPLRGKSASNAAKSTSAPTKIRYKKASE